MMGKEYSAIRVYSCLIIFYAGIMPTVGFGSQSSFLLEFAIMNQEGKFGIGNDLIAVTEVTTITLLPR